MKVNRMANAHAVCHLRLGQSGCGGPELKTPEREYRADLLIFHVIVVDFPILKDTFMRICVLSDT